MKVLHINTKDTGGAAMAALRLHEGLLDEGVDSNFLFLEKFRSAIPQSYYCTDLKQLAQPEKLLHKLHIRKSIRLSQREFINKKSRNYDMFSFPESGIDITRLPVFEQADIINLHWVPRFLDYPSFFEKCVKPVVWTLHDMNPFSGGFHYAEDLEKNKQEFGKIDKAIRATKKKRLAHFEKLYVVTPSKWMLDCSSQSEILGKFPHYHIPYSLNLDIFKPYNQQFARSVFNFPQDVKILLFVSDSLNNRRKGFDLLLKAIEGLQQQDYVLCALGDLRDKPIQKKEKIINLPGIQEERLMSLLYSAVDAFILPSREDNLPNVMLEAIACGIPVISFPVGGMLDVIKTGFNGILADNLSEVSLRKAIEEFLARQYIFNRETIRAFALENFDLPIQAKRYVNLYHDILKHSSL